MGLATEEVVAGQAICGAGGVGLPGFVSRLLGSLPPVDVADDCRPEKVAGVWDAVEKRLSVAPVVNPVGDVGAAGWLPAGFTEEVMAAEFKPGSVIRADWLAGTVDPVGESGLLVIVRP
jgi:hypothetical protein